MLNSYFKLSIRSMRKNRSFSLINILGLAVGIAASLLIFLVIHNEMSYDSYQSRYDRIYRVVTTEHRPNTGEVTGMHSMITRPMAEAMRKDLPALEKVAALHGIGSAQFYIPTPDQQEEKKFKVDEEGLYFTEQGLYDIFDFKWIAGSQKGQEEPNTAVLCERLARTFFGKPEDAVGKTIQMWSYRIPLRITGVFKDLPDNTDVPILMGASYKTFRNLVGEENWDNWRGLSHSQCFVLARENHDIRKLQAQMPAFVKNNFREEQEHALTRVELTLQPLSKVHLDKRFNTLKGDSLSVRELWTLALIGAFLLLVACVNFVNLATAQAINRAKEIGVRKVLGSDRSQLISQFLGETAFITFCALLLGVLLTWITVPYLATLMDKKLALSVFRSPAILLFLLIIGILVTLLAGFYPALVLSGFNPLMAIKSRISSSTAGGISMRRGLVVFQFVIAQLLVIGTLVVVKQMSFFRNKSLGFVKEAITMIDLPSDSTLKTKYPYLLSEMSKIPGVEAASYCWTAPASHMTQYSNLYFDNDAEKQPYLVKRLYGDSAYNRLFSLQLVAGRLPFPSDTTREVLVNETLVKKLGLKSSQDIIGKVLGFEANKRYPVTGVLKDFNDNSLREQIAPVVLASDFNGYGALALRLQPDKVNATMKEVEKRFREIYPTYVYDASFVDESIGRFYKAEAITAQLFKIAAFLAIFISCLGLYGLVSFMAVQKTKEVGIRKVLGASVQSIIYLFSKEFTILISIAFLIAMPAAYYFMHRWLADFYYHTNMGWEIFVLAIVMSLAIAWLTVGYKAVKAAMANPVKSLRAE